MCGMNRLDSGSPSGKGLIILTSVCLVPLWTRWIGLSMMWIITKLKGPIADCLNQSKPQASNPGLDLPWLGEDLPENPLLLSSPSSTRKNSVLQHWSNYSVVAAEESKDELTYQPGKWGSAGMSLQTSLNSEGMLSIPSTSNPLAQTGLGERDKASGQSSETIFNEANGVCCSRKHAVPPTKH